MNHAIDTSLLDDSRSFGITYWKESCIDWSCYDAFIIYPSAFSSKIGRMSISLRIDAQLWDDLNDNGTVDLSVQEIACDGRQVHRGKVVAALIDRGEEKEGSHRWRKLVTREFSCSAESVYLVLIRPDEYARSWINRTSSDGTDMPSGGGASGSMSAGTSDNCGDREVVCEEEVDGIHFTFARAQASDAEAIHNLMVRALDAIPCKDFYVVSSLERIKWKLEENSFAYLALDGNKIVGFYLFMVSGLDPKENLGYEIGLPNDELERVLCMDSVAVDQEYRGHGLQRRLARFGEEEGARNGHDIYLATVDPRNTASLKNFLFEGYGIVAIRESYYQGLPRAIVMKRADGGPLPIETLSDGVELS